MIDRLAQASGGVAMSQDQLPDEELMEAIGLIWKSAGDPRNWSAALESVRCLTTNSAGMVVYTPFYQGPGSIWQTIDAPEGFLEDYVANWQGRDVSLHAVARRMPSETFRFDLPDLIPDPDASVFWQSLYRVHGIDDMSGVTVHGMGKDSAEAMLFAIFSPERNAALAENRRRVIEAIERHLLGAAALHWRLVRAENSSAVSRSLLERISLGTIILSSTRKVLYMNKAARRMIDAADAILYRNGLLQAVDAGANERLGIIVHEISGGGAERPLLLPRTRRGAVTAIAAPPEAGTYLGDIGKVGAILYLSDPSEIARGAGQRLISLYGLSPAEADIAEAIAAGLGVEAIADRRRASINTVKTQVKSIMAKIGASRKSDIVRAVLTTAVLD